MQSGGIIIQVARKVSLKLMEEMRAGSDRNAD